MWRTVGKTNRWRWHFFGICAKKSIATATDIFNHINELSHKIMGLFKTRVLFKVQSC